MHKVHAAGELDTRSFDLTPRISFGRGLLTVAFLVLLTVFVIYEQSPPHAMPTDAPATAYSSGRAMKHLEVISQSPRPLGSAGHAAAREYILKELAALGLQPEVQETNVVRSRPGGDALAAVVRNVVARLKGMSGGKALLLAGHYDTVPNAFGASDDGASVATMLETLRALKAGPPLSNDVIFLFTDGEELGLLGAKAFVEEHPWAKDVGLVLNFEARGTSGPVMMFETSEGNGWLVSEFAKAASSPRANSLSYEIYKLLPNDTDLTEFKGAHLPGLNFAYLEGVPRYHTQADNLANLDERSLQHQGSYALVLAQHFGSVNLEQAGGGNAVYFDLLGTTLLRYPASWVLPLTALIVILFVWVVVLGLKRGRLTVKGIVAGFLLFLLNVFAATAAVYLLWLLITTVQIRAGRSLTDDYYRDKLYFAGFVLVAVAVTAALYNLYRRKVRTENLSVGALLCWVLLLLLTSLLLPGGSYLLAWPLLFTLLGQAYIFVAKEDEVGSLLKLVVLLLCVAPAVVLLVPAIYMTSVALGLSEAALVMPLVVLLCGLLVSPFALASSPGRWWLPGGALLAAGAFLAAAAFNSGFSGQYPKSDHLFYVLNADTERAAWASADDAPDEWTSQFFPSATPKASLKEYVPLSVNSYRINPAPVVPLSPADIRVTGDSTQGDVRVLRMRVNTSHEGISLAVPREAQVEVVAAEVNGRRIENTGAGARGRSPNSWGLQFWAPPKEGFELVLELKGAGRLPLKVVEQSYGLPEIPGTTVRPRPDYIIPSTFPNSNFALVTKSYDL
jgi:hypothetical protein